MGLPPFTLVTGNAGKLAEARRILASAGSPIPVSRTLELDLPEVQSLDLVEVLRAKADEAWRRVGEPVVVEETGLYLAALRGFPGPLVKWMLEAIGPNGIAHLARALGEDRADARCALMYKDRAREVVAVGATSGRLVLPGRGTEGFGWDPVFQPDGETLTYGELPPTEKDRLGHRGRAWRALALRMAEDPS